MSLLSELAAFDVSRLSGLAVWIVFWFVCNAVCYWFVGAFVTMSKERGEGNASVEGLECSQREAFLKKTGRLALRAVSIVHAIMVIPELAQTIDLWNQGLMKEHFFFFFVSKTCCRKGLLWPPSVYGSSFDTGCVLWFEMAAGYYIWDLITSLYFRYGIAYVFHGLLSFPVFLFAAIGAFASVCFWFVLICFQKGHTISSTVFMGGSIMGSSPSALRGSTCESCSSLPSEKITGSRKSQSTFLQSRLLLSGSSWERGSLVDLCWQWSI